MPKEPDMIRISSQHCLILKDSLLISGNKPFDFRFVKFQKFRDYIINSVMMVHVFAIHPAIWNDSKGGGGSFICSCPVYYNDGNTFCYSWSAFTAVYSMCTCEIRNCFEIVIKKVFFYLSVFHITESSYKIRIKV